MTRRKLSAACREYWYDRAEVSIRGFKLKKRYFSKDTPSKELRRRFVWCHGLRILSNCMSQYASTNLDICHLALKVVSTLRITSGNSALILTPQVERLTHCGNSEITSLSSKVSRAET